MTDTDRLAVLAAEALRIADDLAHGRVAAPSDPATIRSLVDDNRELRAAAEPCPWGGHPPMCHKGSEGECAALHREDGT